MNLTLALLSIAAALAAGTVSPGPSFVMVARTSVSQSRAHGLLAALGMGVGGTVFAVAALFGLKALLTAIPSLHLIMKTAGGAYLAYLGYRIWKSAKEKIMAVGSGEHCTPQKHQQAFWLALATQLSNPKCAIVYASVFAALLPAKVPTFVLIAVPVVVFMIEAGWYGLVAICLSAPAPRSAYLRYKTWVDRVAASVMGVLGVKLLLAAVED